MYGGRPQLDLGAVCADAHQNTLLRIGSCQTPACGTVVGLSGIGSQSTASMHLCLRPLLLYLSLSAFTRPCCYPLQYSSPNAANLSLHKSLLILQTKLKLVIYNAAIADFTRQREAMEHTSSMHCPSH